MKCDVCKEREATVHDSSISSGKIVERHVCEACAKKAGMSPPEELDAAALTELVIAQALESEQREARGERTAARCPRCQLSFATFRQGGLLGCPECYAAFERHLAPMLQRYHEGGARHVGKVPRRARPDVEARPARDTPLSPARPTAPASSVSAHAKRLAVLRAQLAAAIRAEQYERAAQVRDELRRLGDPNLEGRRGDVDR